MVFGSVDGIVILLKLNNGRKHLLFTPNTIFSAYVEHYCWHIMADVLAYQEPLGENVHSNPAAIGVTGILTVLWVLNSQCLNSCPEWQDKLSFLGSNLRKCTSKYSGGKIETLVLRIK